MFVITYTVFRGLHSIGSTMLLVSIWDLRTGSPRLRWTGQRIRSILPCGRLTW
jgi:hypothetical protein